MHACHTLFLIMIQLPILYFVIYCSTQVGNLFVPKEDCAKNFCKIPPFSHTAGCTCTAELLSLVFGCGYEFYQLPMHSYSNHLYYQQQYMRVLISPNLSTVNIARLQFACTYSIYEIKFYGFLYILWLLAKLIFISHVCNTYEKLKSSIVHWQSNFILSSHMSIKYPNVGSFFPQSLDKNLGQVSQSFRLLSYNKYM